MVKMKNIKLSIMLFLLLIMAIKASGQTDAIPKIKGILAKPVIGKSFQTNENSTLLAKKISQTISGNSGNFTRVNNTTDLYGTSQSSPNMAEGKDGRTLVIWVDKRNGTYDVYAQFFDKDGNKIGDNFRINEAIGSLWNYGASIDANEEGEFIITWSDNGTRIMAQKVDSEGKPAGRNFIIKDIDYSHNNNAPCIRFNKKGNYVVAWFKESYLTALFFDSAGNAVSGETQIGAISSEGPMDNVAVDTSGNFAFVYSANDNGLSKIFFKYYSDSGVQIGQSYWASFGDTVRPCNFPEVYCSSDGVFCVKWESWKSNTDASIIIKCQLINPATGFVGDNFALPSNGTWYPVPSGTNDKNNNFVFIFSHGTTAYATIISSSGKILKSNIKIGIDLDAGYIYDYKIRIDKYGKASVAWSDNRNTLFNVFYERFDSNYAKISEEVSIPADIGSAWQTDPKIAVQPDGNFLVVWKDERNGYESLYATFFNSAKIPVRDNLRLSSNAVLPEWDYKGYVVKADKKDNYIVLFVNNNREVYFEKFNKDGTLLFEKKIFGTSNLYNITKLDLFFEDSNNIVICAAGENWDTGSTIKQGIFMQTYSENLTPIGTEYFYPLSVYGQTARKYLLDWCVNNKSELLFMCRDYSSTTGVGSDSIYCSIYNYSTRKISGKIILFDNASEMNYYPKCEYDSEGNFITGWYKHNNLDYSMGFEMKIINSSGVIASSIITENKNRYFGSDFELEKDNYGNLILIYQNGSEHNALRLTSTMEAEGNPELLFENNFSGSSSYAYNSGKIYSVFDGQLNVGTGKDIYLNINNSFEKYTPKDFNNIILYNNYPNPFNSSTVISYSLPSSSSVSLKVYNSIGQEVATLVNQVQGAGYYSIPFESSGLSSGVYFYRLITSSSDNSQKMIILK